MSLEQAYQILGRDRARLAGTNYPIYRGPLLAPKSVLTQKAEDLTNRYANRPLPYANKLQTILSRGNQGLSQQETTNFLQNLQGTQRQFRDSLLQTLQNQFKNSYNPRINDFNQATNTDIQRGLGESAGNLSNINQVAGTLEANRNRKVAEALQNLQGQKLDRRNTFINTLGTFGRQEQAHGNLENQANRNQFNRSVDEQQRKLAMLAQVVDKVGGNLERGGIHPDLEAADRAELEQAIKAYNMPQSNYPGQLVAPLPAEIRGVNDVLARTNPALRDSYSRSRRNIVGNLTNNQTVASRALNAIPTAIGGELAQLEADAKNKYEKDLAAINNKYVKLGQTFSPAHLRETEERAKELNRIVSQHRNRLTENALNNQLRLQHEGEIGNINNLNLQANQGQAEVANLFNNFRSLNQLGADKWKNKQLENEEQYKNFQNQLTWEWPQARGLGIGAANGLALGGNAPILPGNQANIELNNLSNLNSSYNSIATPPNVPMPSINNVAQAQAAMQPAVAQAAQNIPRVQAPQLPTFASSPAPRPILSPADEQRASMISLLSEDMRRNGFWTQIRNGQPGINYTSATDPRTGPGRYTPATFTSPQEIARILNGANMSSFIPGNTALTPIQDAARAVQEAANLGLNLNSPNLPDSLRQRMMGQRPIPTAAPATPPVATPTSNTPAPIRPSVPTPAPRAIPRTIIPRSAPTSSVVNTPRNVAQRPSDREQATIDSFLRALRGY